MDVNEPSAKCLVHGSEAKSDVGMLPPDWRAQSLDSVCAFITKGATPTTYGHKWQSDGVLFLRSECVSEAGLDLAESRFISSSANRLLRRSQVQDGDLLMTITGNVGRVVQVAGLGRCNINQHIARIRIDADGVSQRFVYHSLNRPVSRQRFESITTGQAYPQISLRQVRNAPVALPSPEEQRSIARVLDDAGALVDSLEQLIAKKRQIKQGAMQELLTGKKRVAGFDREWTSRTLGEVATFAKGRGLPKSEVSEDGSVPCIHYGELFTFYGAVIQYPRGRTKSSPQHLLSQSNDVLMPTSDVTPSGLAKASCLLASEVVLGGDILVIRPCQGTLHGPFLAYLLREMEAKVLELVTGTTVFHLYASDIRRLQIALPALGEQKEIAMVLQMLDAELTALETKLAKARALKHAMSEALLTGRIRLRPPAAAAA